MKLKQTFRFYPTVRQQRQLAREFECARHAYNYALKLRTDSFKCGQSIGYYESSKMWTKHRNDPAFSWLQTCSSTVQQQSLRNLQTAFTNFREKRTGYPKFKNKLSTQSATYSGRAVNWDSVNKNLRIAKVGRLSTVWDREFSSRPLTVTVVKHRNGDYFVTLSLDEPKPQPLPKTGSDVGVDLGIIRLATLSTGERVPNPKHTANNAAKMASLQRVADRRVIGSGRWKRQQKKIAKLHAHVANCRKDYVNKVTTGLVRRFDMIAIEDLDIIHMLQQKRLAKSIGYSGWGMFRKMLEYKTSWYGKELRVADRYFPSSKRCSNCGHVHKSMPLSIREFVCEVCGFRLDRDHNAAKNTLKFAVGQPVRARGGSVRLALTSVNESSSRGNVNQPALRGT